MIDGTIKVAKADFEALIAAAASAGIVDDDIVFADIREGYLESVAFAALPLFIASSCKYRSGYLEGEKLTFSALKSRLIVED